jgi:hypothetical protein
MKSHRFLGWKKRKAKEELKEYGIYTDRVFELKTNDEENRLKMFNFVRFKDNSGVAFNLLCRSNYFEVRDFKFYADFRSFKNFIHEFKKIYNESSGKASIETTYEDDIIEIMALKDDWIHIHCKINNHGSTFGNEYSEYIDNKYRVEVDIINYEYCQLEFHIEKEYLSKMVNEIDLLYKDLNLL